jgi:hypothetical protein
MMESCDARRGVKRRCAKQNTPGPVVDGAIIKHSACPKALSPMYDTTFGQGGRGRFMLENPEPLSPRRSARVG